MCRVIERHPWFCVVAIDVWEILERNGVEPFFDKIPVHVVNDFCGLFRVSARTPQTDNLKTQLSKLGNTPFEAKEIEISFTGNWFLPASVLADFRRQAIDQLITARRINYRQELAVWKPTSHAFPQTTLTYLGNVMNTRAASFYQEHGVQQVAAAYEKEAVEDAVLMFCKHCLRYSMGWCPIHQRVRSPYKEPYYLVSNDGKRFRLEFDCKNCQMKVKAAQ